ncbi:MAG: hypothetical protein V3V05_10960 [Pontiella sp.]
MPRKGPYWGCDQAEIIACDIRKKKDTGEPYAIVKINAWGVAGLQLDVHPNEIDKFKPHLGKEVSIVGAMNYEVSTFDGSQRIRFSADEIKPLSK